MVKFIIIIFFILFIWAFFIEPNLLVIKHYKIDTLKDVKIVFVSDFHISKYGKKRLERVVNLINKQNPDFVLSGGDFINGRDDEHSLSIEEQVSILKKIKAPFITVLGNHDFWYGKERVVQALKGGGFIVLSNSNINLNGIYLAGVEDVQTGKPDIDRALENTGDVKILLSHSPDIYYDVKEQVNLILAGHTHGGQVSFHPCIWIARLEVMGTLRKRCKTYGCPNLHRNPSGYCDECTARYRALHPRQESDPGIGDCRKDL